MNRPAIVISCEHGGHRVPRPYAALFDGATEVLASHRGWDPGSLPLAQVLARRCDAPLVASTVSRLVIELNRSLHHRRLFSEFTAKLAPQEKQAAIERYWKPYRRQIEAAIATAIQSHGVAVHISVHTFAQRLDGKVRRADIGLLYDPVRALERQVCDGWLATLARLRPDLTLRRNYPYLGKSDGLTTFLRKQFRPATYAGIELELNQRWATADRRTRNRLFRQIADSLQSSLTHPPMASKMKVV